MSFFEDLGALIKKYNLELHTIQIDENVARFNEAFKINVRKEELPPPVLLFRTNEGDFIPTNFGPITINNEQHNAHFINIKEPSKIIDLFSVEEKKEEVKEEKKAEKKVEKKDEQMEQNETPKTEEPKKEVKKSTKKEKKETKTNNIVGKRILIIGPLFKKENYNTEEYTKFVNNNLTKLSCFNTLNEILKMVIGDENYANNEVIKPSTKRGKEVIDELVKKAEGFDTFVLLQGYEKASELKKLLDYAEKNNISLIKEQDF